MTTNKLKALVEAIVIKTTNVSDGYPALAHGDKCTEVQKDIDDLVDEILELYTENLELYTENLGAINDN